MSAATVIAIVVAVGEARDPTTASMLAAAKEALAPTVTLRLLETPEPSDDAALGIEDELEARAVIAILWEDATHLRVHTRVHVARSDRWTDREIVFAQADTMSERGRALGFAIASMLPDSERARRPPPPFLEVQPPAEPARAAHVAIGLGAVGAVGLGGTGDGIGGAVDGRAYLGPRLALRVGLHARWGNTPASPENGLPRAGSSLTGVIAAGAAFTVVAPTAERAYSLTLRTSLLGIYQRVTYADVAQPPMSQVHARTVPGADLVAEVSWPLGGAVDMVLGVGAEVAFGQTTVDTVDAMGNDISVDKIQRFRGVAEGGLRVTF